MAKFCSQCGAPQPDGAKFCASCGKPIVQPVASAPVNPQPVYRPPVYGQPIYSQPITYVAPKIPGRGLGIAAMVLGIVAQVYGAIFLLAALETAQYRDYDYYRYEISEDLAPVMILVVIPAILAMCFSVSAKNKGYRNGVSNSGMVLSVISLACALISFVILQG